MAWFGSAHHQSVGTTCIHAHYADVNLTSAVRCHAVQSREHKRLHLCVSFVACTVVYYTRVFAVTAQGPAGTGLGDGPISQQVMLHISGKAELLQQLAWPEESGATPRKWVGIVHGKAANLLQAHLLASISCKLRGLNLSVSCKAL
mgnify:CR=1 FL=1